MVENLISSKNLLPRIKHHMLSYEKSPFLNKRHYSNNLLFSKSECISLVISDCPINLWKEMLQADDE